MEQFLPIELALDLEKLGFNEPCFGLYTEDKMFSKTQCVSQKQYYGQLCAAPTIYQAFRFFRKEYGLIDYIHPFALWEDTGTWCYEITDFSNNWDESFVIHSPEEAELECLKKLIEIAKTKKNNNMKKGIIKQNGNVFKVLHTIPGEECDAVEVIEYPLDPSTAFVNKLEDGKEVSFLLNPPEFESAVLLFKNDINLYKNVN